MLPHSSRTRSRRPLLVARLPPPRAPPRLQPHCSRSRSRTLRPRRVLRSPRSPRPLGCPPPVQAGQHQTYPASLSFPIMRSSSNSMSLSRRISARTSQPCRHERPSMPAPALATIPDLEKLRDILKPQAQPLVVPLCPTPSPPPSSGALTSWKGRLQPNGLCQINVEYIYMDSGSTGNAADRDWAHQLSSPRSVTNRGGARARKAPVT
jgi:hypothetical protein